MNERRIPFSNTPKIPAQWGTDIYEKGGRNPAINTQWEDVWPAGGIMVFYDTGQTVTVESSSNSDRPGSGGASVVRWHGLDGVGNLVKGYTTLDGNSPVIVSNDLKFIFAAYVSTHDTGDPEGYNAGDIFFRVGTELLGVMPSGTNTLSQIQYVVPASHKLILNWTYVNFNDPDEYMEAGLFIRPPGEPFRQRLPIGVPPYTNMLLPDRESCVLDAGTWLTVRSRNLTGGNLQITAGYGFTLITETRYDALTAKFGLNFPVS